MSFSPDASLLDDQTATLNDQSKPLHPLSGSGRSTRIQETRSNVNRLVLVVAISVVFFLVELIGGWWTGSLALVSDSFHLLSDSVGYMVSLISIYIAQWPASNKYSYGFHRAEVVGVMCSVFLLYGLTGMLLADAWERLQRPTPINGPVMLVLSSASLLVYICMALCLGHDHHHHHHHHEHEQIDVEGCQHRSEKSQKWMNMNVKAAMIHAIGDALYALGVVISSVIIVYDPSKTIVDPICTFIFSVLVVVTSFGLLRDSIYILMQTAPSHVNPKEVKEKIETASGGEVTQLHIWNLTVDKMVLTCHLTCESADVQQLEQMLDEEYGIRHVTIQLNVKKEVRRNRAVSWLNGR